MDKNKLSGANAATTHTIEFDKNAELQSPQGAGSAALALMNKPLTYLSDTEEKVVRMRYGLIAGPDCRLERVGQASVETRDALLEIEARAFAMTQADSPAADVKSKIIDKLREH